MLRCASAFLPRALIFVLFSAVLLAAPIRAHAASIRVEPFDSPGVGSFQLQPGGMSLLAVVVEEVPAPGLAAFQFDLFYDPSVVTLFDPNDGSPFNAFIPLGGDSFCTLVRGVDPCPDPPWFLTSTGREPLLASEQLDNATGFLQMAYGTQPGNDPPQGGGTLALIGVMATSMPGQTMIELRNVILSDNGEPPTPFEITTGDLMVQTPEPGTAAMLALGLGGLALATPRRRR